MKTPKNWMDFLDCWMWFKDDTWVDKDPIAAFNELREEWCRHEEEYGEEAKPPVICEVYVKSDIFKMLTQTDN